MNKEIILRWYNFILYIVLLFLFKTFNNFFMYITFATLVFVGYVLIFEVVPEDFRIKDLIEEMRIKK